MGNDTQANEKKELILNAATKVLTGRGLQLFSFESVAAEAGLSRQLIRHYYPNVEALIEDLTDHLGKAYQDLLITGIVEIQQVERLKFFLDFFFGVSDKFPMPDNLEAYDGLFAYAVSSDRVKQRLHEKYQTLGQVMKHELAIAHPELNDQSCDELSFLFVIMMHSHWSYVATLGYSTQHNQLVRDAFARLIDSYRERASKLALEAKVWSRES